MHLHAHCSCWPDFEGFRGSNAEIGFGTLVAARGAVGAVALVRSGGIAVVMRTV